MKLHIYNPHYIFDHIFDNLSFVLTKNKINHVLTNEIDYDDESKLWISIWNDENIRLPKNYIVFNTEPLKREYWFNILKNRILNSKFCIDYSYTHSLFFDEWGFENYKIVPYGYCENNEIIYNKYKIPDNEDSKKDIDILFYGCLQERRRIYLDELKRFALENNLNLVIRDNNLYGYDEKCKIISRSKIVLSIAHQENLNTNDMFRLSFLASNRVFFLTEKLGDKKFEDKVDDHFIFFNDVNDLKNKILHYLIEKPYERKMVCERIYSFLKLEMDISKTFPIEQIIGSIP
jgi:hypothetical protein